MIFQSGRSVIRLPKSNLPSLRNRRTGLSSSRVERVPALYNVFQSQHHFGLVIKSSLITPILRRTYAQRAVSRPKAHTGRTTTAARKAPTTSKTKAAKKPAPKKTTPKAVPKAKSKAKPRIKPKPKPAKKAKAKAKPKTKPKPKPKKPKKVLTEVQKSALIKKQLKATALKPPHGVASSTWGVFLAEKLRADSAAAGANFGGVIKAAGVEYKQLTPEQLEHYNHIANQARAANATAYRQWIESHTPTIIHDANLARQHLKRLGVKAVPLQDHRQVKGLSNPYSYFYKERMQSGDFRGLKVAEAAKLIGREWKGLSASEKKPFEDSGSQDLARYTQERKTVLNKDVRSKTPKA